MDTEKNNIDYLQEGINHLRNYTIDMLTIKSENRSEEDVEKLRSIVLKLKHSVNRLVFNKVFEGVNIHEIENRIVKKVNLNASFDSVVDYYKVCYVSTLLTDKKKDILFWLDLIKTLNIYNQTINFDIVKELSKEVIIQRQSYLKTNIIDEKKYIINGKPFVEKYPYEFLNQMKITLETIINTALNSCFDVDEKLTERLNFMKFVYKFLILYLSVNDTTLTEETINMGMDELMSIDLSLFPEIDETNKTQLTSTLQNMQLSFITIENYRLLYMKDDDVCSDSIDWMRTYFHQTKDQDWNNYKFIEKESETKEKRCFELLNNHLSLIYKNAMNSMLLHHETFYE